MLGTATRNIPLLDPDDAISIGNCQRRPNRFVDELEVGGAGGDGYRERGHGNQRDTRKLDEHSRAELQVQP